MDPLNIPCTIFLWVLKFLTSDKCRYSHSVQICDSNTTTLFNIHGSWPMVTCTDWEKNFTARMEVLTLPENCFLISFVQRGREMGQAYCRAFYRLQPRSSHPSAETHPPYSIGLGRRLRASRKGVTRGGTNTIHCSIFDFIITLLSTILQHHPFQVLFGR